MKPWLVDKHIDTSCPSSPQAQPAAASTSRIPSNKSAFQNPSPKPAKAPEKLPSLAYSMLKDKDLRKKLAELGISNHGTRQMMEKRHQEWVMIWNANCDSSHPKKRSELLNDLDVWERTVGSRAPAMSKAALVGAQIKDKDFDGTAWAAKHDDSFKDLIANARKTRLEAQKKAQESAKEEEAEKKETAQPPSSVNPQPSLTVQQQTTTSSNQPQMTSSQPLAISLASQPPTVAGTQPQTRSIQPYPYINVLSDPPPTTTSQPYTMLLSYPPPTTTGPGSHPPTGSIQSPLDPIWPAYSGYNTYPNVDPQPPRLRAQPPRDYYQQPQSQAEDDLPCCHKHP